MINVLVINECGCIYSTVVATGNCFHLLQWHLPSSSSSVSVSISISIFTSIFLDSRAACYRNLLAQCGYCASNLAAFVASVCCLAAVLQLLLFATVRCTIASQCIAMKNVYHIGQETYHKYWHHPEITLVL